MKKVILIKIILLFHIILLGQLNLNRQTTADRKVNKILQSDTIWFKIQTKNCWGGGTTYLKYINNQLIVLRLKRFIINTLPLLTLTKIRL